MGPDWKRPFLSDAGVRGFWRILAFIVMTALFAAAGVAAVGLVLGPVVATGRGLVFWQGAIVLAAALAAGGILLARLDRRPFGALGFARTARTGRELLLGLAIGTVAIAVAVIGFAAAGWLVYRPDEGTFGLYTAVLLGDLVVFGIAAAAEEALFRGYPFQVLVQGLGPAAATAIGSVAFALAHYANPNVGIFALANVFLAGVLLSVAYLRTRSLWFATGVHGGWNWAMASLFDLPVSGLPFFDTPLYEPVGRGPAWATGGAFGPEGGVAATVAFAVALLAVWRIPAVREAPEMAALRPLADDRLA